MREAKDTQRVLDVLSRYGVEYNSTSKMPSLSWLCHAVQDKTGRDMHGDHITQWDKLRNFVEEANGTLHHAVVAREYKLPQYMRDQMARCAELRQIPSWRPNGSK